MSLGATPVAPNWQASVQECPAALAADSLPAQSYEPRPRGGRFKKTEGTEGTFRR